MSGRRHLVYPGGFVRTTLLSRKFDVRDPRCWFCLRATCGWWWFHFDSGRVVCGRCLDDPWSDDGVAGRDAETRLLALRRPERAAG